MTRKNFLKRLFGCSIVGCLLPSLSAKDATSSTEQLSEKKNYLYRRYVAEKYVDKYVGSLIDSDGKQYFFAAPVGYVQSPNNKVKEMIEIPTKYRRVYCNNYTVYSREMLVEQLVDFFKTRKTGTFLDRI